MKKKLGAFWTRWAVDVLVIGGAASITTGAALVAPALGFAVGGALAILAAVLLTGGGGGDAV